MIVLSLKLISLFDVGFLTLAMERVLLKLSEVCKALRNELAFGDEIAGKICLCVGSVSENQNSVSVRLAI